MNEPFDKISNADLIEILNNFAHAQSQLAARTKEDSNYWHHFSLCNLLREAAERVARLRDLEK